MLEGWGKTASLDSEVSAAINPPKTINTSKDVPIIANYVGALSPNIAETSVLCYLSPDQEILITNNNTTKSEIYWKFHGILA